MVRKLFSARSRLKLTLCAGKDDNMAMLDNAMLKAEAALADKDYDLALHMGTIALKMDEVRHGYGLLVLLHSSLTAVAVSDASASTDGARNRASRSGQLGSSHQRFDQGETHPLAKCWARVTEQRACLGAGRSC
jgi:hypothetical protein